MKLFDVTYLFWKYENQTKRVEARRPSAAANKAYKSGPGYSYFDCAGKDYKTICHGGPAVKVQEVDTGKATFLELYEWG